MRIKLLGLLFLFLPIIGQSQTISLKTFLVNIGYKDFKFGMTVTEFKELESYMRQSMTIDNNISYKINDEFSFKFLNLYCDNYYSFNKSNMLKSISWEIDNYLIDVNDKNKIADKLSSLLGNANLDTVYNDPTEVRKMVWLQDSLSLTYYYKKRSSRSFISLTKPSIKSNPSPSKAMEDNEKFINKDRVGKGNNMFNLTLSGLEKVVVNNLTRNSFETILPQWNSEGNENSISLAFNKKTQEHDIPIFNIFYDFKISGAFVKCKIEIEKTITNKINYVEVTFDGNGETLARFRKSLDNSNYYQNENLTSIFRKSTFTNKVKGTSVTIKENSNYTYTIGVRK